MQATITLDVYSDGSCEYELYQVSESGKRRSAVTEPYFVLLYSTDPHARVALEAYADSCAGDLPKIAEAIYRELGFDIEVAPANMDKEMAAYLARVWQGRWVAVRDHRVIAAGDTIANARAAVNDGARFSVLHVPVRAAAETAAGGPTSDAHG